MPERRERMWLKPTEEDICWAQEFAIEHGWLAPDIQRIAALIRVRARADGLEKAAKIVEELVCICLLPETDGACPHSAHNAILRERAAAIRAWIPQMV